MPVSTRSHILSDNSQDQDQAQMSSFALRNPHHGLKEKLKSLTLFYEQHKLSSGASAVPRDAYNSRNPNREAQEATTATAGTKSEAQVPRQNLNSDSNLNLNQNSNSNSMPNATVKKTYVLPPQPPPPIPPLTDEAKENIAAGNGGDRIVGFTCPRKQPVSTNVARKLSLGSQLDHRTTTQIQDPDPIHVSRTMKDDNNRVMVYVRLRPLMRKEKDSGARSCVKIANRRDVYLTEFASEHDYLRLKRLRGRHFTFDASFSESAAQQDVYSATTAELVGAVLEGRNGSVFCYGATGAGKTYTMLGTVENPGVMVLAMKDLFTKIRQRSVDGNHVVHLSYLEVYNETVRDLLSPGRPLILREDKQGTVAAGLTQYRAYSTDEVMALLLQGNKNRTTEPTRVNETSSRSHAILQVSVEYRARDASMNIVNRVGKLSLIDLAGSERALATDQRTVRSIEGANINRSLLALSSCINALVEGKRHIPYRNSKLTQILKDSLGGACNTVMIANISPSNMSFGETQNTLHWADRAKEIRNKVYDRNEEVVPESEADQAKLLLEVQKENRELRVQLAKQQQKLLTLQTQSLAANSSSPAPSSVSSFLSPPLSSAIGGKQRPKSSLRARNCETPEPRKVKGAEDTIRELQKAVRMLEAEMGRMKKDHMMQLNKKDEIIKELTQKAAASNKGSSMGVGDGEGVKFLVTRASLRPKNNQTTTNSELKTPRHRFQSPGPTAKKRSFWDITTANSPSVTSLNGRKTKSHVTSESTIVAPPSMLLQPGFARQKISPYRQ